MDNGLKYLYITARAAGKSILYLSLFVIMLVLRHTITVLRNNNILTSMLDHNIYIHKVIGTVIFVLGTIHTVTHATNFIVNVVPDPVVALQLFSVDLRNDSNRWIETLSMESLTIRTANKTFESTPNTTYRLPENCLFQFGSTEYGGGFDKIVVQKCKNPEDKYTFLELLLTTKARVFGTIPGWANPTGVGLQAIMTIIFVFSLPFIRRTGRFELFYFSHLLYGPYIVLLLLHAPLFWMWFVGIGTIWVLEKVYRFIHARTNKTVIQEGVLLSSNVTNLVIRRPNNFKFNAGDWVFIKVGLLSFIILTVRVISVDTGHFLRGVASLHYQLGSGGSRHLHTSYSRCRQLD